MTAVIVVYKTHWSQSSSLSRQKLKFCFVSKMSVDLFGSFQKFEFHKFSHFNLWLMERIHSDAHNIIKAKYKNAFCQIAIVLIWFYLSKIQCFSLCRTVNVHSQIITNLLWDTKAKKNFFEFHKIWMRTLFVIHNKNKQSYICCTVLIWIFTFFCYEFMKTIFFSLFTHNLYVCVFLSISC